MGGGAFSASRAWNATLLREAYLPDLEVQVRADPNNGALLATLAGRYGEAGRFAPAAKLLERAVAAGEDGSDIWLTWAASLAASGDRARASGVLKTALQRSSVHAAAQAAIDRCKPLPPTCSDTDLARAISPEGPAAFVARRTRGSFLNGLAPQSPKESGFATRQRWAKDSPGDVARQTLWAEALLKNGRHVEAGQVAATVLKTDPKNLAARLAHAEAARLSGLPAKSGLEYTEILKTEPNSMPALIGMGRVALEKSLFPIALEVFGRATKQDPKDPDAWIGLGRAHYNQRLNLGAAVEAFQKARTLAPERTDFNLSFANAQRGVFHWAEAEQLLRARLADVPDDAEAHFQLGSILLDSNRTPEREAEAEKSLRRSLELEPGAVASMARLGGLLVVHSKPKEAIPLLEAVIADDIYNVTATKDLAQAYRLAGRAKEAKDAQESFTQLTAYVDRRNFLDDQLRRQPLKAELHEKMAALMDQGGGEGQGEVPSRRRVHAAQRSRKSEARPRSARKCTGDDRDRGGQTQMRRLLPLVFGTALLAGCPRPPAAPTTATTPPGSSGVKFVESAEASGVRYAWSPPGKRPLTILGTIGNGAAFFDADNDGNLDLLLVGPVPAFFQGDGKGKFVDGSSAWLGGLKGYFLGVAVGDYDNDGFEDVYLSGYREGRLLHNEGGKRLKDVTPASGIPPQRWGTSASWADLNGDGKLDLYVAGYAQFGPDTKPQLCSFNGVMSSCGPRFYDPERGTLFQGDGKGKFTDISEKTGAKKVSGRGLGVAILDYDGSGRDSIAIANDELPGDLLQNHGGRFTNEGASSGTAYDADGRSHGGMGVDWGDYDNDGKSDLVVATFQHEVKSLYQNQGGGIFQEKAALLGLSDQVLPYITFGIKFLDADNDGWLDLLLANGHVQDNIAEVDKSMTYKQPTFFLRNREGKRFQDETPSSGIGALPPIVGRGLATGDYDNDGRVDALVVDAEGKPLLLHNETPASGHWLLVKLEGTKSNRSAHGALLTATFGGKKLLRHCQSDGSYLSASDNRVHFGLGAETKVDLSVRWPSGATQTFSGIAADRIVTIKEGDAAPH